MNETIANFINVHKQESVLAKKLKSLKEQVKNILKEANQDSYIIDGVGSVSISESKSLQFDEQRLMAYLEEHYPQCIIQEPKIDYTLLDKLAYENQEIIKELVPFQYEKVTERINVKYVKD